MKRSRPRPISARQRKLKRLQDKMQRPVKDRDGYLDILTGEPANDVHEICPKTFWGPRRRHLAFQMKNMACVSRATHREAACQKSRWQMLTKLQELYGYSYEDEPWSSVIRRGEDG